MKDFLYLRGKKVDLERVKEDWSRTKSPEIWKEETQPSLDKILLQKLNELQEELNELKQQIKDLKQRNRKTIRFKL